MQPTPKSLRLQIGLFGRTNVGKSSFLNLVAGQEVAITSPVPGTTTDVVEKPMELLPLGPVVVLDTAGLDDASELGAVRLKKTRAIFDRADFAVLVVEPDRWTPFEDEVRAEAARRNCPLTIVVNKTDRAAPSDAFRERLRDCGAPVVEGSSLDAAARDRFVSAFKAALLSVCPEEAVRAPALLGDLLPPGGLVVLVVPIDLQAPKGRLILPQVQAIRDALDSDASVLVVKEREFAAALTRLARPPDLVVCDSQVVLKVVADTPPAVPCTTFSILMARFKGDLAELARGAAELGRLRPGDRVLIAEACSHHALEDDIGRVKIPRWLRQYAGVELQVEYCAGRDYPAALEGYRLIVHCGSCMLTRREMLGRLQRARAAGVPVTNYGVAIAALQGVAGRALEPFPSARLAYDEACAPVPSTGRQP